jgi:hypothetical protein
MQFLLLIAHDEDTTDERSPEEMEALLAEYGRFYEDAEKQGILLHASRLRPTTEATTVRVREGRTRTTDGPFAETKEVLGGFFLVDVADRATAVAWAARLPAARYGAVEVRPLWPGDEG